MTDVQALEGAIKASGLSARRFASEVLGRNERTVRHWLAGDYEMPRNVVGLCRLMVRRPSLVDELRDANRLAGLARV